MSDPVNEPLIFDLSGIRPMDEWSPENIRRVMEEVVNTCETWWGP